MSDYCIDCSHYEQCAENGAYADDEVCEKFERQDEPGVSGEQQNINKNE